MKYAAYYSGNTVVQVVSFPWEMKEFPKIEGLSVLSLNQVRDAADIYVAGNSVVERPRMPLVYTSLQMALDEEWVVSGIPAGTVVHYPGGSEVVNDGQIEWSSEIAGQFTFTFELFPFKSEVLRVEVG